MKLEAPPYGEIAVSSSDEADRVLDRRKLAAFAEAWPESKRGRFRVLTTSPLNTARHHSAREHSTPSHHNRRASYQQARPRIAPVFSSSVGPQRMLCEAIPLLPSVGQADTHNMPGHRTLSVPAGIVPPQPTNYPALPGCAPVFLDKTISPQNILAPRDITHSLPPR